MNKRTLNRFIFIVYTLLRKNNLSKIERLESCCIALKEYALELKLYNYCDLAKYGEEIKYIKENGICYIPYYSKNQMEPFEKGIDPVLNLPYVIHKGKRLYFPQSYSLDYCAAMYEGYISKECLLGNDYIEKAPHQYLTESFRVDPNTVLVDVGSAEALLSLDSIEVVDKVFLIEADSIWIPALKATFSDYKEKVEIINKYVSGKDSESTITLKSILKNENKNKNIFIKMDIEGAEIEAIEGSKDFLSHMSNIKIASCTYHNQGDAEALESLYKEMGYKYEYSDGYMLFPVDKNQSPPFFRHGVIRGWK